MCCANAIDTGALDAGAVQLAGVIVTCSGSARLKAPLARWTGPLTLSAASPAVEMTFAVVAVVYVRSAPGVNAPKAAAGPSVSESVAGTEPPMPPPAVVAQSRCALAQSTGKARPKPLSGTATSSTVLAPTRLWVIGTAAPPGDRLVEHRRAVDDDLQLGRRRGAGAAGR